MVQLYMIIPVGGDGPGLGGGGGPVDPGYSPGWARPRPPRPDNTLPGRRPRPDNTLPGDQPYPDQGLPGFQPRPDHGLPGDQPYPDQGLPGHQPRPDHGYLPYPDQGLPDPQPHPEHPWIPPQAPVVVEGQAHLVMYIPNEAKPSGYERITFTIQVPEPTPPTEATPKTGQPV